MTKGNQIWCWMKRETYLRSIQKKTFVNTYLIGTSNRYNADDFLFHSRDAPELWVCPVEIYDTYGYSVLCSYFAQISSFCTYYVMRFLYNISSTYIRDG